MSDIFAKLQEEEQRQRKSLHQSASQSTDQLVDQPTPKPMRLQSNPIVDRPKAFYITQHLDRKIDEAVRYFQEKYNIKKVDRSTIVNAIMDNEANWTEEALDLVVDRVISSLTSRLTG
jgi:hypothetical protein